MRKLINILLSGCFIALLSSCDITENIVPCPVSAVRINLFAEVFQNGNSNDPLNDTEPNFYSRIKHLQYFLYKDGVLVDSYKSDVAGTAASHMLTFADLERGNYHMVIVGNCKTNSVEGDPSDPSTLQIVYPGWGNTEDFFYQTFDFVADNSGGEKVYDLGLFRAHGFTRMTFETIPSYINKFRIRIEDIYDILELDNKTFSGVHDESVMFDITSGDYIIGTLPTIAPGDSHIYIDLYHEDDPNVPYHTELIGNDLKIVRNQLLNIGIRYDGVSAIFTISLDTDWNGALFPSGGGVELD